MFKFNFNLLWVVGWTQREVVQSQFLDSKTNRCARNSNMKTQSGRRYYILMNCDSKTLKNNSLSSTDKFWDPQTHLNVLVELDAAEGITITSRIVLIYEFYRSLCVQILIFT